jgi:methylenetetrahydrofolate dehydrogenase (NADP+) / methenyltetrahydrofolate cyclohydrolase
MILLEGKVVAQDIQKTMSEEIEGLKAPHLVAILVGNDTASQTYVNHKIKACAEVGFKSTLIRLEDTISEEVLLSHIDALNKDPEVDGFIVQLPLPRHINPNKVTEAISPNKDVDGFHPINIGKMAKNLPAFISATPLGILKILEHYHIETSGKHCVIVGRSQIVGSPMSMLLSRNSNPGNCTVTLCHSKTVSLKEHTKKADILIAAIGIAHFIKADMVKEGAVVVDVGMNRLEDSSRVQGYRLVGDVDFDSVAPKSSYITPVPGGVGPMTVAALLYNTYLSWKGEVYLK